ncbi:hypothetical protein BU15DRAFT_91162 [Melanogaster broomeanus]|nr:hypothetical protein BU15DRAFT_91162 [Melanogaster broomeanus]
MQLTLSSESVRNAVITNETGQVLYKTSHPFTFGKLGTTTIRKIQPSTDPLDMRDHFDLQTNDFLSRHGIRERKRTFTGPDGLPYRWDMLFRVVVLSRNDGSRTEVARYHRGSLGIIGHKKKPHLEVDPDVMHMLDLIVLTFVYVEKLRMDKERHARGNGGGGP